MRQAALYQELWLLLIQWNCGFPRVLRGRGHCAAVRLDVILTPVKEPNKIAARQAREERLRQALRENLKRRKVQMRRRGPEVREDAGREGALRDDTACEPESLPGGGEGEGEKDRSGGT